MATANTQLTKGHFHCTECGSLFEDTIQSIQTQRCPVCGNPPTGKVLAGTEQDRRVAQVTRAGDPSRNEHSTKHGVNHETQEIYEATLEAQQKGNKGRVKRTKRREKASKKVPIAICVWIVLTGITVGLIQFFDDSTEDADLKDKAAREFDRRQEQARNQNRMKLAKDAAPQCEAMITAFFNASSPAAKSQYVYRGRELAAVMSRYYREHASFSSVRSKMQILRVEWLDMLGRSAVGAVLRSNLGETLEAVFIKDGKEWKLDWESLIKYGTDSWSLFPTREKGTKGTFRLYVRIKNLSNLEDLDELSIVFYKPDVYFKKDTTGMPSSSIRIPKDSDLGKKLLALHEDVSSKSKDEFGFTLKGIDPDGFIRVRASFEVSEDDSGKPTLELTDILSNHWYGGYSVEVPEEEEAEKASE
ncbi:MAG: hypothetical protein ACPG32_13980 [Akkermansiaceae bacterium]